MQLATIKHIASKNANYGDAELYLTFRHDEFSMKPVLDERGHFIPREEYLFQTLLCGEDNFAIACMKANLQYEKNNSRGDVKSHHYIISFDPRDGAENGLTMEKAQALGVAFCQEHFPGHQAIVCTHPDGHNHSGNIHCHIVINSLRIEDVPFLPYMDRPCDTKAGMKHRCTASALRYFRSEVMEMCHRENLYQIDLLSGRKDRITEREYWAKKRGQARLDQQTEQPDEIVESTTPATRYETDKEKLRVTIRSAMEKAKSFEEFSSLLLQSGITVKESRGRFSYLTPDRTKPITSRKLGDDYSKEAIMAAITRNANEPELKESISLQASGTTEQKTGMVSRQRSTQMRTTVKDTGHDLKKVIDTEAKKAEGYGKGYEIWGKVFNLQQKARALVLFREHGFDSPDDLDAAISDAHMAVSDNLTQLMEVEAALKEKKEYQKYLLDYLKARDTYREYQSIRSPKKQAEYYEQHRPVLMLREAAQKYFDAHDIKKHVRLDVLKAQIEDLIEEKNRYYTNRREALSREKELITIKANIEAAIGREFSSEQTRRRKEQTI